MAFIRVYSGATGANTGLSWTDAFVLYQSALTAWTKGDIILVSSISNETFATAKTLNAPNDNYFDAQCIVIVVDMTDDSYSPKPVTYQLEDTDWELLSLDFHHVMYGISLACNRSMYFDTTQMLSKLYDGNLVFKHGTAAVLAILYLQNPNSEAIWDWYNTDVTCLTRFYCFMNAGNLRLFGGTWDLQDTSNGQGIFSVGNKSSGILAYGVDFSSCVNADRLFNFQAQGYPNRKDIRFDGCKLPSGVPIVNALTVTGNRIQLVGSDIGTAYEHCELHTKEGTLITTTAVYADDSQANYITNLKYGLELTPESDADEYVPFESEFIPVIIESSGEVTLSLELAHDMTNPLTNMDFWIDVFYAKTVDIHLPIDTSHNGSDSSAIRNILGAATQLATSTAGWTGADGLTKQKVEKIITVDRKGPAYVKVYCSAYEAGTSIFMSSQVDAA